MAIPFVPGPSNWFVSSGSSKSWEYLGQCERDTRIGLSPEWEDVFVDGGGTRLPYDRQFMGASASASGDLVRYNAPVLQRLKNWYNNPAATPGIFPNGAVGTLLRTEGYEFSLIIVSTYRTKTLFSSNGMVGAYYFPFAVPVGSWDCSYSTAVKRERIAFECLPVWNLLGGGTLYTNDISGFSLPAPN